MSAALAALALALLVSSVSALGWRRRALRLQAELSSVHGEQAQQARNGVTQLSVGVIEHNPGRHTNLQ